MRACVHSPGPSNAVATQAQYLVQDSLYLQQFAKVLALIAAKSDDRSVTGAMAKAAHTVWPSQPHFGAPCESRVRVSEGEGI